MKRKLTGEYKTKKHKKVKNNLNIGRKLISFNQIPILFDDKSEDEITARGKIQSIHTGIQAFMAVEDRLPLNQGELDPDYTSFSPTSNYTYSFYYLNTGICYTQATTSYPTLHSFTLTETKMDGDIVCKKNVAGTPPSDVADYTDHILSCKIDSTQN